MREHDINGQDQLTRLLRATGPDSLPALEPDPHLPARIRARAREDRAGRNAECAPLRPRWARLSLGTAALTVALVAGGYLGYRAGASTPAPGPITLAQTDDSQAEFADAFWDAWSQSGFEEDFRSTGDAEMEGSR